MKLLHVNEVCGTLGIKESTLRKWIFNRRIPFVRVGRLVKFEPEAIQRFIEENRVERAS
jgi:excisionase family DNA binding protein